MTACKGRHRDCYFSSYDFPSSPCHWLYLLSSVSFGTSPNLASDVPCAESVAGIGRYRQALYTQGPYTEQIQSYLDATLNSLDRMRGESGLVVDTIVVQYRGRQTHKIQVLNPNTSPTNIAVDLLVQAELALKTPYKNAALSRLSASMPKLGRLDFDKSTGLFYSRYSTDSSTAVRDLSLSSIDNLHLAIALWTIGMNFHGTPFGDQARRLFKRMDFSAYYDVKTGLIGGNLILKGDHWIREDYQFSNLGSEARILYSVGYALGLFRNINDLTFLERSYAGLNGEILKSPGGPLLKLWDGSAFQLYFPQIFVNENLYSPKMGALYRAQGNFMISEGQRRRLLVPAGHSAGRVSIQDNYNFALGPPYRDKAGNKSVVSSGNGDLANPQLARNWDGAVMPYALFMAAISNPEDFMPIFSGMQTIVSGDNPLYIPSLGWMDALHVKGNMKGQVVPAQLSLNQGMIALSLIQMLAPDGMGLSGKTLYENSEIRERLDTFYSLFDRKLEAIQ